MSEGLRDRLATIIAPALYGRVAVTMVEAKRLAPSVADALIGAGVVLPTDPPGDVDAAFDVWAQAYETRNRWVITDALKAAFVAGFAARIPDPTPPAPNADDAALERLIENLRSDPDMSDASMEAVEEMMRATYDALREKENAARSVVTPPTGPTPSELRDIANWLDIYEATLDTDLPQRLREASIDPESDLWTLVGETCPGNEMQDDLRWWADEIDAAGAVGVPQPENEAKK